jgi:sec-independent protein translocase protein TatC
MTETEFVRMTLAEHLDELRVRLLKCVIVVVAFICIALAFQIEIMQLVTLPLEYARDLDPAMADGLDNIGKLHGAGPTVSFFTHMKVCIIAALFAASPFILFQLWKFIASGLHPHEKKGVMFYAPLSFLLLTTGLVVGYRIVLPIALNFLLSYGRDSIEPLLMADQYLSFFFLLTLVFGVTFELPLVMMFFARIGLVEPATFSKYRAHAIVGMFVLSAILTPPDVVTQLLMATPLAVLYEFGILLARAGYRKSNPEDFSL